MADFCSRKGSWVAASRCGALPPATAAGLARCGGDGSDEDGVLRFLLSSRVFGGASILACILSVFPIFVLCCMLYP